MKKNNFEENRTKETADEALSQKDSILLDIKNIFDSAVYVNKHSANALEKIHQLTPDAY